SASGTNSTTRPSARGCAIAGRRSPIPPTTIARRGASSSVPSGTRRKRWEKPRATTTAARRTTWPRRSNGDVAASVSRAEPKRVRPPRTDEEDQKNRGPQQTDLDLRSNVETREQREG